MPALAIDSRRSAILDSDRVAVVVSWTRYERMLHIEGLAASTNRSASRPVYRLSGVEKSLSQKLSQIGWALAAASG
jgi:hypothetical protein